MEELTIPWMDKLRELIKEHKGQAKHILTDLYKYGDEQEKTLEEHWKNIKEAKEESEKWSSRTEQHKKTEELKKNDTKSNT